MSTCAAYDDLRCQGRCGAFDMALKFDRCTHLVFGEFCDSVLAQAASRGQIIPFRKKRKINQEENHERREQERRRDQFRKIKIERRESWQ
jgi:hypothetical protein